ncbi:unnamed protein product [Orchesella dallaii]|uniref:UBC core domain-containing protein n=1 Tax=Orchesella dallaii TaxID=48710 RepID=A0ABP1RDU6_9HEXA
MACLNALKHEIQSVEQVFNKTHERFQVVSSTLDELICCFICKSGKKHNITANITEAYPHMPPVWFTDTEETSITDAVGRLSSTTGLNNHVVNQVAILVRELCQSQGIPEPTLDLEKLTLTQDMGSGDAKLRSHPTSDDEIDDNIFEEDNEGDDEENEEEEDDRNYLMEEDPALNKKENEGLNSEQLKTLRRLQIQENKNLQGQSGTAAFSLQASDRLMKELRFIYKSDSFKKGIYTVELINDSLYEWKIELKEVDKDSPLNTDLMTLKEREGKDFIELHMLFKENFPFEPPFVRVVHPMIRGGYVLSGGAICMELLTKQGWSSAYTIEAVIMQIAATFVKGEARIEFEGNGVSVI